MLRETREVLASPELRPVHGYGHGYHFVFVFSRYSDNIPTSAGSLIKGKATIMQLLWKDHSNLRIEI